MLEFVIFVGPERWRPRIPNFQPQYVEDAAEATEEEKGAIKATGYFESI